MMLRALSYQRADVERTRQKVAFAKISGPTPSIKRAWAIMMPLTALLSVQERRTAVGPPAMAAWTNKVALTL